MLKIKQWLGVAGFALAAAAVAAPAQADELSDILKRGELRVAVQTSGPLMSFMDKTGKRTGLAVEVAKRMADDLGVKLVLQDYEWKGLIPALLSGKADMVAADMTPTPQRAAQVLFSAPMFYADTVAVVPKDSPYKSYGELDKEGVTVGVLGASTYAEVGKKMLPKATMKEFSGGSAPVGQALSSGRLDAGIMSLSTANQFLVDFGNLRVLDGIMVREPLAFAVGPNAFRLKFWLDNWQTLKTADNTLPEQVKYWYSTDWKKDH
ncbi:ABC transporter substrate-binding protein [Achromobacter veterisilvae]|uniref:ABC transporter substrate-binding protein n=1 Tax=Achromobacter veterisilvae TaxID=2069367 RepID=A0A446CGZ0_9BURK|nr:MULTISPECIES: ABC transporter substrate-binding protein [Achromobacter]MCW0211034.1 ABC transporter substrate-binding protein [Achromobacter sp.]SSW67088.1 Arginine-binding extracellular protein ArtP [Achromobacter veterisilvae]